MLNEVSISKSLFHPPLRISTLRARMTSMLDLPHCSLLPKAGSRGRWVSTRADPRVRLTPSWELRPSPQEASVSAAALPHKFRRNERKFFFSTTASENFPFSSEITLSQELAIFLLPVDHVMAAVCFLPVAANQARRRPLLRQWRSRCRYYAEATISFSTLMWRTSSLSHQYVLLFSLLHSSAWLEL